MADTTPTADDVESVGESVAAVFASPSPMAATKADTETLTEEVLQFEPSVKADDLSANTATGITAWLFRANELPRVFALSELGQIVQNNANFAWIDLSTYAEADLQPIARTLHLHPLGVRAALAAWQRPRFDNFRDHFFISATVAHLNTDIYRVYAGELDLFVGNNYLVSTHKLPLPFAARVLTRARQSPELVQLDSAFMLYLILDELLEYYEELSDHIETQNEKMEQRALKETSSRFLSDLLQLKRYIFALSRLADQHRRVFAALTRPDSPLAAHADALPYVHDLESHFERLMDTLLPAREAVNGAFDIYVSHVSHRTNQIIKTLTIVSSILLPATLVIGIFSTSIQGVPLYAPPDFFVMIGIILLMSAAILFAFWRRGWL